MKQLFHIINDRDDNVQKVLSLRLGEKHAAFAITDKTGSNCYQLNYCTPGDPAVNGWTEQELADLFATYPVLGNSFYEVLVAYDLPRSMLVPSVGLKQEDAGLLLQTVGQAGGQPVAVTEVIAGWQLYNTFTVARGLQEWVAAKFPSAKTWHQYSLGIKNLNTANSGGLIQVDFRKDDFTVLVTKENKFLLAQAFDYSTPEDVIYYLLKICEQFSLSQQELLLRLSGLVDKQSALFKELFQYFIHVEFREANWDTGSEYPSHFFTSLNDLARCAS